jgi:hypothetical protein
MPALRIFDPYAFLADEGRTAPAEKAAKAVAQETETLATLAALAGVQANTSISPPNALLVPLQNNLIDMIEIFSDCSASPQKGVRIPTPAKVAKPAKVGESGSGTLEALAAPSLGIENSAVWGEAKGECPAILEHDGKVPRRGPRASPGSIIPARRLTCRQSAGSCS